MRGDMAIKELRRMGKKPVQVWVFLLDEKTQMPKLIDPEDLLESDLLPEIHIEPHEDPQSLDLRFLAGVIVHLQGQDSDRLRSAYARLKTCQPSRIITSGPDIFHDTGVASCKT